MAFTFEARTLLELGKELISNDDIALYELIKNSVDAGSPTVDILVRSRLPYTDYREARRQLHASEVALSEVTTFLRSKMVSPHDKGCDALVVALNSTVDRTEYEKVLDYHYEMLNTIVIRDRGEGMSLDDLQKVYLRIGTRNRRRQNEGGATKLGDKGIGRLSAMRLGDTLRVKTTKAGEKH
ncbi:MAG: ATP-binding protein [Gammaproteobacteria bacterium]|nr:ATP-binding protein [Gammaproteobacteria bacterium]